MAYTNRRFRTSPRRSAIDLLVETRSEGDWVVLSVKGEVDVYTAPKLRQEIISQVESRHYKLLVDLAGVEFMDSTGLAVLVGGLKRVKENEGALILCGARDPIMRVLSLTGLNKVFPIHATLEEAIASAE